MSKQPRTMRWNPYAIYDDGSFDEFWREHLKTGTRKLLFVVGRGFDLRADAAPARIASLGTAALQAWVLVYQNGQLDSPLRQARIAANMKRFAEIFGDALTLIDVRMGSGNSNTTSRNTKTAVSRPEELAGYTDVIVDISAMPRTVALTAIAQLIAVLDELAKAGKASVNLHVVVAESVDVDRRYTEGSLSDVVTSLVGFSGQLTAESSANLPRVWFPVLGEGQLPRLERIRTEVDPDEICPVIPFPSRDPHRGDSLIEEYRAFLFDDFRVEPSNIIYASEYNPFEAYRQLYGAIDRYRDALREMGGCKVFVSPLSSKLLSVGALLACYDHKSQAGGPDPVNVGIPYLESATYGDPTDQEGAFVALYSLWLRGEWEQ